MKIKKKAQANNHYHRLSFNSSNNTKKTKSALQVAHLRKSQKGSVHDIAFVEQRQKQSPKQNKLLEYKDFLNNLQKIKLNNFPILKNENEKENAKANVDLNLLANQNKEKQQQQSQKQNMMIQMNSNLISYESLHSSSKAIPLKSSHVKGQQIHQTKMLKQNGKNVKQFKKTQDSRDESSFAGVRETTNIIAETKTKDQDNHGSHLNPTPNTNPNYKDLMCLDQDIESLTMISHNHLIIDPYKKHLPKIIHLPESMFPSPNFNTSFFRRSATTDLITAMPAIEEEKDFQEEGESYRRQQKISLGINNNTMDRKINKQMYHSNSSKNGVKKQKQHKQHNRNVSLALKPSPSVLEEYRQTKEKKEKKTKKETKVIKEIKQKLEKKQNDGQENRIGAAGEVNRVEALTEGLALQQFSSIKKKKPVKAAIKTIEIITDKTKKNFKKNSQTNKKRPNSCSIVKNTRGRLSLSLSNRNSFMNLIESVKKDQRKKSAISTISSNAKLKQKKLKTQKQQYYHHLQSTKQSTTKNSKQPTTSTETMDKDKTNHQDNNQHSRQLNVKIRPFQILGDQGQHSNKYPQQQEEEHHFQQINQLQLKKQQQQNQCTKIFEPAMMQIHQPQAQPQAPPNKSTLNHHHRHYLSSSKNNFVIDCKSYRCM